MSANPILPPNQHDFKIAIICALTLEAQAVAALFDIHWDNKAYNQAPEDTNTYSVGTIGGHNVVLVHLHNIGKVAAATAAAFLRTCYKGIRLALVVGICGGVPFGESLDKEILMGDVVISDGIIQYDFGSQYPDEFRRKGGVRDNLPRPGPLIRGFLTKLKTSQALGQLEERMLEHLRDLQQEPGNTATYPGAIEDRLFNPTYQHKHHGHPGCSECKSEAVACDEALRLGCEQLGCDEQELVPRVRSMPPSGLPVIHFGLFASGDSVMKSGKERDKVASEDGVIAFEMEGAGLWETFPHCLIIKSVCDYADSHKNKRFQSYAAATAAVTTKAILEIWNVENEFPPVLPPQNHAPIPIDTAPLDPARKGAIFKMLYTSPYRDRKERNPDRVPGTCEWFVSHTSYDRWRTSTSSSMLWVSADPGCGKSVLVKHLVDSELPTTQLRTTCYFFFKDDFTDQRSASGALCCILHQLFKQREVLLSNDIVERFETGEEYLTGSFGELWDILVTASRDENAGEIVCIIDAFDECEEQGRSEFTRYLQKFYGTRNNSNLKFLLTSRPYGNIRRGFEPLELPGLPVIHLSGENEDEMKKIAKEIDIYIKAQVRSIRNILKLKCAEEQILLKELLRVPNRTYIWAHLTLDVVQNDIKLDKAGIYKATSQLPQTVDEAYERILAKSCDSKEARRLLHIVVAAARPLTLSEMELALFLRANHPWNKGFEPLLEERFREYARDLCGLFIAIIDSKIYLLHQTAKEFLVQDGTADGRKSLDSRFEWKSSFIARESHCILLQICIWHLLFVEFETPSPDENPTSSDHLSRHILLDYSAKNWPAHFRMSSTKDNAVTKSSLKICDADSVRCPIWFRVYWESTHGHFPRNFTALMIASYFGLRKLVELSLESNRSQINICDGSYQRSALSWASEKGFDNIVKLLLKSRLILSPKQWPHRGADIEAKDKDGRSALLYAARNGHVAIAERLIKKGACVDSMDNIGGTPLTYALCSGQKALIKLLLPKGHEVGSLEHLLSPLLLAAAENGDKISAELFIESGKVNPNLTDSGGRTPLLWASIQGHEAIVKLLLDIDGIDANLADNDGQTPLFSAVDNSHEAVFKLLIESGKVFVNLAYNNWTPLLRAIERDNKALVKLLLKDRDIDINLADRHGQTPLSFAAERGCKAIVKLLLENSQVKTNHQDKNGRTPLSYAAGNGHEAIVKLLLKISSVDVDLPNRDGQTPLSFAAKNGYEATVKLLLKSGKVDANLADDKGQTPLLWASRKGHEAVVELLLDSSKVDANLPDMDGSTPLSVAARKGHGPVVKLLLESSNIDANLPDEDGQTPLSWAAERDRETVVKLLLESGKVDVNLADKSGWTPLSWATNSGHEAVVDLLENSGLVLT